jgi:hypothetical protein
VKTTYTSLLVTALLAENVVASSAIAAGPMPRLRLYLWQRARPSGPTRFQTERTEITYKFNWEY